jgi:hypothetical protein
MPRLYCPTQAPSKAEQGSSCQAKRAALFAEKLATDILPPVSYRHWTFTIPKAIWQSYWQLAGYVLSAIRGWGEGWRYSSKRNADAATTEWFPDSARI